MTSATELHELEAIREIINRVLSAQHDDSASGRAHARTEILIHSIAVFSRRGLERTTVQDLLDAANISRRTFYKYFRNKFDVLESIYQIFIENMILRFRLESERSRSVTEVVRNSCNIYFDYHLSLGPIIRLMMEEARRADSVLAPHRDTAHKAVAGVMKAGMQRVTGRELDGLVFLTLIWTLESYSLYLLNRTDCSAETIAYYKGVMTGIAGAILSDQTDWSKPSSVL